MFPSEHGEDDDEQAEAGCKLTYESTITNVRLPDHSITSELCWQDKVSLNDIRLSVHTPGNNVQDTHKVEELKGKQDRIFMALDVAPCEQKTRSKEEYDELAVSVFPTEASITNVSTVTPEGAKRYLIEHLQSSGDLTQDQAEYTNEEVDKAAKLLVERSLLQVLFFSQLFYSLLVTFFK